MDGLYHDKFDVEARKISNILNIWDFGYLVGALKKFAHEEPHRRMQLVLKDYFKQSDLTMSQSALEGDANIIRGIFPQCSVDDIKVLLREVGNEENRVRLVVKKLLCPNRNARKRFFSNDVVEDGATTSKKSRLVTSTVVSGESTEEATNGDEAEVSPSTTVGPQERPKFLTNQSAESDSTIIDPHSYSNEEVLVQKPESDVSGSPQPEQAKQTNKKQKEIDRILEYLISGIGPKNEVEEVTDHDKAEPMAQEAEAAAQPFNPFGNRTEQPQPHSQSTDLGSENLVGEVRAVPEGPLVVQPGEEAPSAAGPSQATGNSVLSNSVAVLQDTLTSTSDSSDKSDDGKYNIYRHLKEMFSNISRKDIKAVCTQFNTNKREMPSERRFNAIITSLLAMTSRPTNDDSDISPSEDATLPRNVLRIVKQNNAHVFAVEDTSTTSEVTEVVEKEAAVANSDRIGTGRKLLKVVPHPNEFDFGVTSTFTGASVRKTPARTTFNNSLNPPPEVKTTMQDMAWQEDREALNQVLRDLGEQVSDEDAVEELFDEEDGAVDNALVYPLMEMFPEACPAFIRKMCAGKSNTPGVLDNLISRILEADTYPRRQKIASPERRLNSEEQLEILKQVLPDADPSYLQIHCDRLIDKPDELKLFMAQAIEHRNYPTMKDYLRKQQLSAQQKQYTSDFSVEKFLEVIPNPDEYFNDSKRKPAKIDFDSQHYTLCFLRNHFNKISMKAIREVFRKQALNFFETCRALEVVHQKDYMKSKRPYAPLPSAIQNIPLLQEIAYYENRSEIKEFLNLKKTQEAEARAEAKQAGLLQTCSCCFDDEVMPKDIYRCENGCIFCKECVRRGAEVAFGDGKLDFLCLNNCSSHFSLQTLQAVLPPKMFSKVALKKQLEEVTAAGIEDLEMCPFCDFATIPAKEDRLFRCFNPECMKESCRLCKEPSHVPLRCDEVEKDDDVKKRTYIENKMTEALLRKCYKCGMKFIKADGCNKMTCSCGALMCYVCGQPVKDYKHFNGPGGEKTELCPLYSDTNQLHQEAVLKGAEEAKQEIGVTDSQLKIDPTADIQQHYKQMAKQNPPPPNFPQRAFERIEEIRNHLEQQHQQLQRHVHHRHQRGHHHNRP